MEVSALPDSACFLSQTSNKEGNKRGHLCGMWTTSSLKLDQGSTAGAIQRRHNRGTYFPLLVVGSISGMVASQTKGKLILRSAGRTCCTCVKK